MANAELGQRISTKIDGAISTITRASRGQYYGLGHEKVATVHYRKDGEQTGLRIQGMPVVGHSEDIVHLYEGGQVSNRFKLGNPPRELEVLSAEETHQTLHPSAGMENY